MATTSRGNGNVPRARSQNTRPKAEKPEPKPKPEPKEYEKIEGAISGNLTGDPELRFTSSGRPVASFNVASTDRTFNEDTKQWEDSETEFYRVNVWNYQAEHVAESLKRGDRIVAIGYFQDKEWTDREGETRVNTEFTANELGASLLFREVIIKPRSQR